MVKDIARGFRNGVGFALGLVSTALLAVTVGGAFHTFSSGEVLDASKINANFATLKSAVESIDPQYSTSEVATHKVWVDGKVIYRKVIDTGTLPNTGTSSIAHGITTIDHLISIGGYAEGSGLKRLQLPHAGNGDGAVDVAVDNTNVIIVTASNQNAYTASRVIIEYTKL